MRFKQIDGNISGEGERETKVVKLGKIDIDKTDPSKMVFTKVLDTFLSAPINQGASLIKSELTIVDGK